MNSSLDKMHHLISRSVPPFSLALGLLLLQVSATWTTAISKGPTGESCPSQCKCRNQGNIIFSANCSNRQLERFPANLSPYLRDLNLANNFISVITMDSLKQLVNLQHLNLRGNRLKSIESNVFTRLWRLQSLDLAHNFLSKLQPRSFRNLTSLKKLSLRNNYLLYLPGVFPDSVFEDLYNLIELDIKRNTRSGVNSSFCYPDVALSKLSSLEKLHIDGMLQSCLLGSGFQNLTKLSLLDFGNPVDNLCWTDALPELFFSNLTTSTDLDINLFNCDLKSIHPLAFSHVPSLTSLVLAKNDDLEFDQFNAGARSFPSTRLKRLDISSIKKGYLMNLTFDCISNLRHTSLESLIMKRNHISDIFQDVPTHLPRTLKYLDISNNRMQRADMLFTITWMINLEVFILDTQNKFHVTEMKQNMEHPRSKLISRIDGKLSKLRRENVPIIQSIPNPSGPLLKITDKMNMTSFHPKGYSQRGSLTIAEWIQITAQFCDGFDMNISASSYDKEIAFSKPAWLEKIWHLIDFERKQEINRQRSVQYQKFPLPRKLRVIRASDLKLGYSIPPLYILGNKVIEHINFSSNFLWCFEGPLRGVSSVKVLDLSKNFAIAVHPLFFSYMDGLTRLSLEYNSLGTSLELDTTGIIFSHLKNLEYIDLAFSDIHELSQEVFTKTTRLRHIRLKKNALYRFSPKLLQLFSLEYLDLSFNDLPGLSEVNMQELDELSKQNKNLTVNILHNPLICDCSNLHFIRWFMKTKVKFLQKEKYYCQYINGSHIFMQELQQPLNTLWRICNGQLFLLISIILLSVITITLTTLAFFSYHKYKLYYYLYISKQRVFHHLLEDDHCGMQDIFLVFDDQDVHWRRHILDVFLPHLTRADVSYHVSEVGVDKPTAGRPIWEVVQESVLAGRKTIVLLTRDIFLDNEKQLAVNMAKVVQDMTGNQRLIFLCAEKMIASTLPKHLYHLLKRSNIIRYTPECNRFWINLVERIKN